MYPPIVIYQCCGGFASVFVANEIHDDLAKLLLYLHPSPDTAPAHHNVQGPSNASVPVEVNL